MMRKCEIAVGVVNLLLVAWAVLEPYIANTAAMVTSSGYMDGPTSIYVSPSPIGYAAVFAMTLSGMLLLTPSRRKSIVMLSALFVFLHIALMFLFSTSLITMQSNPYLKEGGSVTFSDFCPLLLSIANMSLLLRRGVRRWRKDRSRASA